MAAPTRWGEGGGKRAKSRGLGGDEGQAAHEQLPCQEELTATEELSLVQASPLPAVAELTTARIESWRCGQGARRTGAPSNPDAGEPSRAGGGDDDQEAELPEATASHVGLCDLLSAGLSHWQWERGEGQQGWGAKP